MTSGNMAERRDHGGVSQSARHRDAEQPQAASQKMIRADRASRDEDKREGADKFGNQFLGEIIHVRPLRTALLERRETRVRWNARILLNSSRGVKDRAGLLRGQFSVNWLIRWDEKALAFWISRKPEELTPREINFHCRDNDNDPRSLKRATQMT